MKTLLTTSAILAGLIMFSSAGQAQENNGYWYEDVARYANQFAHSPFAEINPETQWIGRDIQIWDKTGWGIGREMSIWQYGQGADPGPYVDYYQ
jgi:hypothetical protein